MRQGVHQRTVTLLSLPQVCEVCEGKGTVRAWGPESGEIVQTFLPCLHCVWRLPVVGLPIRSER